MRAHEKNARQRDDEERKAQHQGTREFGEPDVALRQGGRRSIPISSTTYQGRRQKAEVLSARFPPDFAITCP
jgi:hypothetical protein